MRRLGIADRGPGWSYRPDDGAPSIHGAHQPGIASPQLDHLAVGAFDLTTERAPELRALLADWSLRAESLMAPGLTVTIGLGASLFEREALGLRAERPRALRPLPAFRGDALDPARSGGDLCVLVGADRAAAAADALGALAGVAKGAAATRWTQTGFLRRDPGARAGTSRDLLGFRDGIDNLRRGRDRDRHVWVGTRDRSWMVGGTYLVLRRIRIALDDWNRLPVARQERVIGRHKASGAPLGRRRLFDAPPLWEVREGQPVIPADAHVRLAAPSTSRAAPMLRRGYSYDDGVDAGGVRDAGLLFLAYQRDPQRQYVPVQRRLAEHDALSAFIRHTAGALFAVPPGARAGGFVGEGLFERPGAGVRVP